MQRYFIQQQININEIFEINQDDLHHIKKVMRNRNGDKIICIDTNQNNYLCEIEDIENGFIKAKEQLFVNNELDINVTLIYALPKGDKFELVLQKACELGVHHIVPLLTNRCVVKTNPEKFNKKLERYRKILKEASEQSVRNVIPDIETVIKLKDIQHYLKDYNLVAYEETAKNQKHGQLYEILSTIQAGESIAIIIGSEGGFDESEIQYLQSLGVQCCSLGKRILRSETAPLYALSVIGYSREVMK